MHLDVGPHCVYLFPSQYLLNDVVRQFVEMTNGAGIHPDPSAIVQNQVGVSVKPDVAVVPDSDPSVLAVLLGR